jgi:hypothetical protein
LAAVTCVMVCLFVFASGCRRRSKETAPVPTAVAAPETTLNPTAVAPVPMPPASADSAAKTIPPAVQRLVDELNYALQDYRERTGTLPKSVAELAMGAKLAMPALPPGAQLRINTRFKMVEYVPPGAR